MKLQKYKKLIIGIMLILVAMPVFFNVAEARINETYYNEMKQTEMITSTALTTVLSLDILIDPLAKLVYSIGNVIEYLVGGVVQAASGMNVFPWADAIVFNAVPMLDVNFISPASESIFGMGEGTLQTVIKNLYASLFSLAELFFGIAVLLMGIKLAISAVASEKAKYKDALVSWSIGLVLLFGMQFFISFVFYLNEEMVVFASNIASDQLQDSKLIEHINNAKNYMPDAELTKNFVDSLYEKGWIDWGGTIFTLGLHDLANALIDKISSPAFLPDKKEAKKIIEDNPEITASLLRDAEFREAVGLEHFWVSGKSGFFKLESQETNRPYLKKTAIFVKTVKTTSLDELKALYVKAAQVYEEDPRDASAGEDLVITRAMYNAKMYAETGEQAVTTNSIITGLANYFKTGAFSYEEGGWRPTKVIVVNAVLYTILVIQSVTLLIAFIKRLFYVVVLALMAPIIVVYDFAKKLM